MWGEDGRASLHSCRLRRFGLAACKRCSNQPKKSDSSLIGSRPGAPPSAVPASQSPGPRSTSKRAVKVCCRRSRRRKLVGPSSAAPAQIEQTAESCRKTTWSPRLGLCEAEVVGDKAPRAAPEDDGGKFGAGQASLALPLRASATLLRQGVMTRWVISCSSYWICPPPLLPSGPRCSPCQRAVEPARRADREQFCLATDERADARHGHNPSLPFHTAPDGCRACDGGARTYATPLTSPAEKVCSAEEAPSARPIVRKDENVEMSQKKKKACRKCC